MQTPDQFYLLNPMALVNMLGKYFHKRYFKRDFFFLQKIINATVGHFDLEMRV